MGQISSFQRAFRFTIRLQIHSNNVGLHNTCISVSRRLTSHLGDCTLQRNSHHNRNVTNQVRYGLLRGTCFKRSFIRANVTPTITQGNRGPLITNRQPVFRRSIMERFRRPSVRLKAHLTTYHASPWLFVRLLSIFRHGILCVGVERTHRTTRRGYIPSGLWNKDITLMLRRFICLTRK